MKITMKDNNLNLYTLKELKELFGYSQNTGLAEMSRASKYIKRVGWGVYCLLKNTPVEKIRDQVRKTSRLISN